MQQTPVGCPACTLNAHDHILLHQQLLYRSLLHWCFCQLHKMQLGHMSEVMHLVVSGHRDLQTNTHCADLIFEVNAMADLANFGLWPMVISLGCRLSRLPL